jgi:putative alpha-1,2-mannosidase
VWSALGLYPLYPGRAELVIGSPLFPRATVERPGGAKLVIKAQGAAPDAPYVDALRVDGHASDRAWLPARAIDHGVTLDVSLARQPNRSWATATPPPSFGLRSDGAASPPR